MSEFKLVHCNNQNLLDEMHNIRERVLFTDGKYDRHHPDDTNPDNQCFVLLLNDKPIATVRLDFIRPDEYAIRLVAVLPDYQGKKMGSKMMNSIFDYANQKGICKLVTNAAIEATKFYESLGFVKEYWIDTGEGVSRPTIPMVKELTLNPELVQATISDYPTIQNMARFYVYDMSRYCGFISDEWAFPKDGLYESHDFKKYFIDKTREAFLVKIKDELAGFVLLNKIGTLPDTEWNMGEFFIIAKFQGRGIAREVANQIWKTHPGKWEVSVIPENDRALNFWRKTITHFTHGHYHEVIKEIDYDNSQPKRYILSFDTNEQKLSHANIQPQKSKGIEIEEINQDQAESLCRSITQDLPEYFGIPSANEQYFEGVRHCKNLAAKTDNQYVGLISLNFPYANNSNIYWMAVFKAHQTQGIGRKLVEKACQLSRKLNATTMTVETLSPEGLDENYLKTYQFYQSSGFKPLINLKPKGYEWKMVYMVKQLGDGLHDLLFLEKDAREFGFEWPNEAMIIEQVIDECKEIKEAIEKKERHERIQEEIGDLLHSTISLCDFSGFDVNETLIKVNLKFGKRMQAIKKLTHELGLPNLKGKSIDFMMELWRKAKNKT